MRSKSMAILACLALLLTPSPGCTSKSQPVPNGASGSPHAEPMTAVSLKPSNSNPDLSVDDSGLSRVSAVIATSKGTIRFKLYPKDAPETVHRLIELIQSGFYNGLKFHQVWPNFLIQTGDPQGTGLGGSGKKLKAELNNRPHNEGTMGMARLKSDPDSADSQFYICLAPAPQLNREYTVFGLVVEGINIAKKIQKDDVVQQIYFE